MLLFMIYQYSSQLERVHFAFRRADYVFCVVFIWTILSVRHCVIVIANY